MRLFISAETQESSGDIIVNILRQINREIGNIEVTDYTSDLDSIGIIINSFDEHFLLISFGKTRRYISYKKCFADIRLNIPHEEILVADKQKTL